MWPIAMFQKRNLHSVWTRHLNKHKKLLIGVLVKTEKEKMKDNQYKPLAKSLAYYHWPTQTEGTSILYWTLNIVLHKFSQSLLNPSRNIRGLSFLQGGGSSDQQIGSRQFFWPCLSAREKMLAPTVPHSSDELTEWNWNSELSLMHWVYKSH